MSYRSIGRRGTGGARRGPWVVALVACGVIAGATISFADDAQAATHQVNFGPVVVAGWAQDDGQAYDRARGYGWHADDGRERQCFRRNAVDDPLRDSVCRADDIFESGAWVASPATWSYDLPGGEYAVTVAVGDPGARQRHSVNVEGVQLFDDDRNDGRAMLVRTATVTVTDGALTLAFTPDRRTAILWLTVEELSALAPTTPPATTTTTTTAAPGDTTTTTTASTTPTGGGAIFGEGVIAVDDPIVIGSGDLLAGAGRGVTVLVPGPGYSASEGPLVRTATLVGEGEADFVIRDLTIDCRDRCEAIRLHGARFVLSDVEVRRAAGHGLHTTWKEGDWTLSTTPGSPAMEARLSNVLIQQSGTSTVAPVRIDGPHDSVITDLIIATHDAPGGLRPTAVEVGPLAYGTIFERLHFWGNGHRDGVVIAPGVTGIRLSNAYLEGATERQLWAQGDNAGTQVEGTRVQCFPASIQGHGTLDIGLRFDGASSSGHMVSASTINCEGGGLVLVGGAGELSTFALTRWNSGPMPVVPASSRLDVVG